MCRVIFFSFWSRGLESIKLLQFTSCINDLSLGFRFFLCVWPKVEATAANAMKAGQLRCGRSDRHPVHQQETDVGEGESCSLLRRRLVGSGY